ncbi:MAG TPA: hypothetical protein VEB21_18075 [Terriglobales bacterium]|nr:hypothetical protein [Terriglobales bacterium]
MVHAVWTLVALLAATGSAMAQTATPDLDRRVMEQIHRPTPVAPGAPPGRDSKLPGAKPLDVPDHSGTQEMPLPPLPLPPR